MSAWTFETDDQNLVRLFELARNKTAAGRTELARVIGDLFTDQPEALSDRERALMSDILRKLVGEVEMSVRKTLAENLADDPGASPELVKMLADDDIEVAHPILVTSLVLKDEELVEIIRHRTMQHQLAIAMRRELSENVCDALVETGNESVISTLIDNHNAKLSAATMAYLVEESERVDSYQNPLLRRPDLSPELVKKMYWWVSAALREHIMQNFEIDPIELDEQLEGSVARSLGPDRADDPPLPGAALAEEISFKGPDEIDVMIEVLRAGEVGLFESVFARVSGLRSTLLRRIAYEPGGEALAIVGTAVGMDETQFAEVFRLTRKARPKSGHADEAVEPALELFREIDPEAAKKVLRSWRRDPRYLKAIHDLALARSDGGTA